MELNNIIKDYPTTFWLELYKKFYDTVLKIPEEGKNKYESMISSCSFTNFEGSVKLYIHRDQLQKLFLDLWLTVRKATKLTAKPLGGLEIFLFPFNVDYEAIVDFFTKIHSSEDIKVAGTQVFRASEEMQHLFSIKNIEPILFNFVKNINIDLFFSAVYKKAVRYPNIKEYEGVSIKRYLLYYLSKILWSLRGYVFREIGVGLFKISFKIDIIPYTRYTRYLTIKYSVSSYVLPRQAKDRINKWKNIIEIHKMNLKLKDPYYLLEKMRVINDTTKTREYIINNIILKIFEYYDHILENDKLLTFLYSLNNGKKLFESKLGEFIIKQRFLYNFLLQENNIKENVDSIFINILKEFLSNKDNQIEEKIKEKYKEIPSIDKIIEEAKFLATKIKNAKNNSKNYWKEIYWNISAFDSIFKTLRYKDYSETQSKVSNGFNQIVNKLKSSMQSIAKSYIIE